MCAPQTFFFFGGISKATNDSTAIPGFHGCDPERAPVTKSL